MKMKKMLKGIVRLMLALIVTCGVGLVLFQVEAKALPKLEANGEGGAKVTNDVAEYTKVEFYVGGVMVDSKDINTTTPESLDVAKIMPKWDASIERDADGKAVITAKLTGTGVDPLSLTASNNVKTNPVVKVSLVKSEGVDKVEFGTIAETAGKVIGTDLYAFKTNDLEVTCKATPSSTAIKDWTKSVDKATVTPNADKTEVKLTAITGDITLTPTVSTYDIVVKEGTTAVASPISIAADNAEHTYTASVVDGETAVTGLTFTWAVEPAETAGVTITKTNEKIVVKANNVVAKVKATVTAKKGDKEVAKKTYEINTSVQGIKKVVLVGEDGKVYNSGDAYVLDNKGTVKKFTVKAYADDAMKVDITSACTLALAAASPQDSIEYSLASGALSVFTKKGGRKAAITVNVSNPATTAPVAATMNFTSEGFMVSINPSTTSTEPGKSITFEPVVNPSTYTGNIVYKWYVDEKLAKTAKTFKKAFSKSSTYTVRLEATCGNDSATDTVPINVSYDDKITIPSTIMLTVGEATSFTANCTNNIFEDADSDEFEFVFDLDNWEKYVDASKFKVSSIAKNGSSAVLSMVGKETYTADKKNTMTIDFGGVESNVAVIYVFKKPQITESVTSGTTPSIKFNVPTYVGTAKTNNMTVTGYRVKIYKGNECLKTTDIKEGTGDGKILNISDILGDVASVANGDSFTFRLGIQPVGKINNEGDVVNAKTADSSNNEIDYVSDLSSEFTIYRLNLTADPGITTAAATGWGFPGQTTEVKATGVVGYWTKNGAKITDSDAKQSYVHTFSSTTAENNIGAVLGAVVPSTPGGTGSTEGLDDVPKTSESNAPIWLIVVLVFAAMGGGYALYLQMRPATANAGSKKSPFTQDGYDDYDDNF